MIESFLEGVAQGLYGKCEFTYNDIRNFMKNASQEEIDNIKELYWECTSSLIDEDEIEDIVSDIETLIFKYRK